MSRRPESQRRGAALLIALATLVVMTVTCATIARVAATATLARKMERCRETADDVRRELDRPITAWLSGRADTVVLPPEAVEPRVAVLHESWRIDGIDHEVEITAFDQCGMVPLSLARGGSPLRSALPSSILRTLDQHAFPRDRVAGLDLFIDAGSIHSPFPKKASSSWTAYGSDRVETVADPRASQDASPAIGAYLATHTSIPPRINVATAPMRVVEQALRAAGRGGVDLVRDARTEGRLPTISTAPPRAEGDTDTPEITVGSDSWAFRIDVRVGACRQAWWEVYRSANSSWKRVQRLVASI